MKLLITLASAALIASSSADGSEAKAEWISENTEITSGKPIRTIIRMTVNEGWHTYWSNPGEGGMEPSLKPDLPEGWTISELQYPVPKRFMTGELPGFGYEGTIDFPLTITPPADASGTLPGLKAKLSWLTCNDSSCVPGDAQLILPGKSDATAVSEAYAKLPQPLEGTKLEANFKGDEAILSLTLPENSETDPSGFEIFPITPNVLDAAAKPRFSKKEGTSTWLAKSPKSEYISADQEKLELLLVAPDGPSFIVRTE